MGFFLEMLERREFKGRRGEVKLDIEGGYWGYRRFVRVFRFCFKSREKLLRILSRKGDGYIFISKRFFSLLGFSVKLVEFIYLVAIMGIN